MITDVLNEAYGGNTVLDWCISLMIIVGAFALNKLIRLFWKKVIKRITSGSKTRLDDLFFESLEQPLFTGIYLLAIWIAAERLNMGEQFNEIIKRSYQALGALVITWFVARFAVSLVEEHVSKMSGKANAPGQNPHGGKLYIDSKFLPLIKRGLLIIIWLMGIMTALYNFGVNVTAMAGTLGLSGIALALAAQDTIKNIFAGVTIFTDRPFRIGDLIRFDATEGTVVDISLRSTRIRTYDKQLVILPNYKLTDAQVTNISAEPGRRTVAEIGLTYGTTPEKMQEALDILKDIPHRVHDVKEHDLTAAFTAFGDSALIITFIYFIRHSADKFEARSKVNFEILRAFNQAGLNFAFPSRTVYIENT